MSTEQTPTASIASSSQTGPRRRRRYVVTGLLVFAATIALFYAEEDWRGRRAWDNCKRELKAKGVVLDWSSYTPPPVPTDQNVFGVPEMQKWFEGRGGNEFTKKLNFPGLNQNTNRFAVANVTIGLPGTNPPGSSTVLQWADGKLAEAEAAQLMNQALGPTAVDPRDHGPFYPIMAKALDEVRPAQIFLQCQSTPTLKELDTFLCKKLGPKSDGAGARVEPTGSNSYRVTTWESYQAADFVSWSHSMEPDLVFVYKALQRPYARLEGDYDDFNGLVPNFVAYRNLAQNLAALAKCHMVLGQPEKALDALTLLNQLRRTLEFRPSGKGTTLVSAMIDVAFAGLYVDTIGDGMRLQVWREPQLAALQAQLDEINLRPYVVQGIAFELPAGIHHIETASYWEKARNQPGNKTSGFWFPPMLPQGWIYQNLVVFANQEQKLAEGLPRQRDDVVPHQITAAISSVEAVADHPSPFNLLSAVAIPNFTRSQKALALNQTKVGQARVACALERYRLAHGEYPSTLDVLAPQLIDKIPRDPIGGQPPHYHRTDDGKFLLYSIGWSETDHGGQSGSNGKEGDWVWMVD